MFFLLESRETIESNITAFNNAGGGNYFLLFKEITVSYDTNQKKQRRGRSVLFVFLIVFLNVFFSFNFLLCILFSGFLSIGESVFCINFNLELIFDNKRNIEKKVTSNVITSS